MQKKTGNCRQSGVDVSLRLGLDSAGRVCVHLSAGSPCPRKRRTPKPRSPGHTKDRYEISTGRREWAAQATRLAVNTSPGQGDVIPSAGHGSLPLWLTDTFWNMLTLFFFDDKLSTLK